MTILQLIAVCGSSIALLLAVYWITRQSRLVGTVVAIGVLVRVIAGLGLFSVSFFQMPLWRHLQLGEGFWSWALDARDYYMRAVGSMNLEWMTSSTGQRGPSPLFVHALGIWLRIVGASPASAILFNLICYVGLISIIVWTTLRGSLAACRPPPSVRRSPLDAFRFRPPLQLDPASDGLAAALLPIVAFTFSPTLILYGTQPLKDVFFATLVGAVFVAAAHLQWTSRRASLAWFGVFVLLAYAITEVRWYYGLLLFGSACVAAVTAVGFIRPSRQRIVSLVAGLVALRLLWIAVMLGNGYVYPSWRAAAMGRPLQGNDAVSVVGLAVDTLKETPAHRAVSLSPNWKGSTNIVASPDPDAARGPVAQSVGDVLLGLAALFVPLFILGALALVQVDAGGAFAWFTNIDTLFLDATLIGVAIMLNRERRQLVRRLPFVIFAVALGLSTTVLMAYVVTNYGAMFRLRNLLAVPFWMLPIAFARSRSALEISRAETRLV